MKIKILAAKNSAAAEKAVSAFLEENRVTVQGVAYAIGPKGEREVLVLYTDGRAAEIPDAVRGWLVNVLDERKAS